MVTILLIAVLFVDSWRWPSGSRAGVNPAGGPATGSSENNGS